MIFSATDLFILVGFIFLCLLTGLISSFFMTDSLVIWYPTLTKSALSPPDWVFAPVWTVLYILMGVALWLVWTRRHHPSFATAATLFLIQLFLNGAWTFCFFYLQNPLLGFIEILGLDLALILTMFFFYRITKLAAFFLFPYALWLCLASYLNFYIIMAN